MLDETTGAGALWGTHRPCRRALAGGVRRAPGDPVLAVVLPVTSVNRGWENHILLAGLPKPSWAMTEQPRTVSRGRLHGVLGRASAAELAEVCMWLADLLGLTAGY